MTTIMEIAPQDANAQVGQGVYQTSGMSMTVKRIGGRPIRFVGSELAMAMSYTPSLPYWYEINLYQTNEQDFVATVRLFYQSQDLKDTVRAWRFPTLDEAINCLADFDAAHDVEVAFDRDYTAFSAAEAASEALQMLAKINGVRTHYNSLVGEFLFDLENG